MGFTRNFDYDENTPSGPLFYYQMFTDTTISDLIFTSYLADSPVESFFEMGGYATDGTGIYEGSILWITV